MIPNKHIVYSISNSFRFEVALNEEGGVSYYIVRRGNSVVNISNQEMAMIKEAVKEQK